jgi:RNA polymerase sigma-70 factor (ECF subfamily)
MKSEAPVPVGAAVRNAPPSAVTDPNERALVAAVLQKDRKATAEFVARYTDPIYGYVSQRLTPRRELVEDVVQEVFLVGLQKLDTFAGESSVQGWLLGIARHKVEDIYRARLREPEEFSAADETATSAMAVLPAIEEELDKARAQEKTHRILERLPEEYGVALLWRYWEQRSTREIAAQTGKTEKAIERLLARARARFRDLWEATK